MFWENPKSPSTDTRAIDEELWNLIKTEPRLLPHFHLSLQSGDDTILRRMVRRHLRSHVLEFLDFIKAHRPMSTIGADIIVGFPTETDEMFEHAMGLYEQLDMLHVFPFSAHENTPAFTMPQVDGRVIKERAKTMQVMRKDCMERLLQR